MIDLENEPSHSMKARRRSLKGVRRLCWATLPFLVVASLLLSLAGLALPTPTLAEHQGEQTAQYLPSDTDLYFTVNLDPGGNQLVKFWTLLNNWFQDPNVQAQFGELTGDLQSETGIDIAQDVLPWLGPEIAVGMGNLATGVPEIAIGIGNPDAMELPAAEPEVIAFIGTMDSSASEAFFYDKLLPVMAEGEPYPVGPSGDYRGIDTLDYPSDTYWAFPDDYIVVSNSEPLLEECLDLMLSPNINASLAGISEFQDAQSALPERAGMSYLNLEHMWSEVAQSIPQGGGLEGMISQAIIDFAGDYIPACLAASISFASHGVSTTAYVPAPQAITLPSVEPNPLKSAKLVPDDTWLFASDVDMNAGWQMARNLIGANWQYITAFMQMGMGELPPGMSMEDLASLDATLDWVHGVSGVDIDADIFGWMTGEYSFALLPIDIEQPDSIPGMLLMFEVDNKSEVQEHLSAIIDGVNFLIAQDTPPGDAPDLLETFSTSVDGVAATLLSNQAIMMSGLSPGWLFVDVDSTHYLVIGTSTDALEVAVKASKGELASLDEAEEYGGLLSLLPQDPMGLGYLNLGQIIDDVLAQIPLAMLSGGGGADIEAVMRYLPSQLALGYSYALLETNALTMTGAVYLLPPPLAEQSVAQGTTAKVGIPEQLIDFSRLDTKVGSSAVSLDVDVINAPEGANIDIIAMKELPEEASSGFEAAASAAGVSILDIAYGVKVGVTNLAAANLGAATITMKVGQSWADDYGTDNIKILRVSGGQKEVLPTEFSGSAGDQAVFVGTSEDGLGYFGLAAISGDVKAAGEGGTNWALIGGIIGGAIVVVGIVALLLLQRRRPA